MCQHYNYDYFSGEPDSILCTCTSCELKRVGYIPWRRFGLYEYFLVCHVFLFSATDHNNAVSRQLCSMLILLAIFFDDNDERGTLSQYAIDARRTTASSHAPPELHDDGSHRFDVVSTTFVDVRNVDGARYDGLGLAGTSSSAAAATVAGSRPSPTVTLAS